MSGTNNPPSLSTIDSEVDKKIYKVLQKYAHTLAGGGLFKTDIDKAAHTIKNLMLEQKLEDAKKYKEYYDNKIAQEANKARVDEIQKIVDWGKTIDDQWNAHFKERLKELRLTADKEQVDE